MDGEWRDRICENSRVTLYSNTKLCSGRLDGEWRDRICENSRVTLYSNTKLCSGRLDGEWRDRICENSRVTLYSNTKLCSGRLDGEWRDRICENSRVKLYSNTKLCSGRLDGEWRDRICENSRELNDSAETSKLNMVRSRSVPYRSDIAGVKTARSPPSPPSFDSPSPGTTDDSDTLQERLASKHKTKVGKDAACRKPMPKVIKVSDVYPTATKIYLPQCTIIHQCAEDTGCCMGAFQKCGPKSSEKVDLYFYTYTTSAIRKGVSPHQIEKLGFYNHTECECHEDMPRDDSNVIENDTKGASDAHSVEEEPPCMCPTDFAVRRFANGTCGCDCFDKERDCLRYKKGKEYFSLKDKWCIKIGKCQPPNCEYGKFSQKTGRCPRLNEKSPFF
ncbi:hypothetical protein WDU94_014939 [Cyamophila willieti]